MPPNRAPRRAGGSLLFLAVVGLCAACIGNQAATKLYIKSYPLIFIVTLALLTCSEEPPGPFLQALDGLALSYYMKVSFVLQ